MTTTALLVMMVLEIATKRADNYSMGDAEEEGYSIEVISVIDLDGMPVSLPELDLDDANIVNGKLDSGKPDQRKFYYEDAHVCSSLLEFFHLVDQYLICSAENWYTVSVDPTSHRPR